MSEYIDLLKYTALYTVEFGALIGVPLYYICKKDKTSNLFKNCGIVNKDGKTPLIYKREEKDHGYNLTLHIPEGITISDIEKHREALEMGLSAKIELVYTGNQKIVLKAFTGKLKALYPYEVVKLNGLSFPLGYSYKGMLTHTMDDENPHMLVGGTSGSGKSVCLREIISNIILTKSTDELKLHLCDLKGGVEFAIFKHSNFVSTYSRNIQEAYEQLSMLKTELYRRLELFEHVKAVNLDQYNKRTKSNLPRHVVIIDELANITLKSNSLTDIIDELLRLARAVGVHIILSTQRPSADVLPGTLKANISTTIAFKTRNSVNSQILLDHGGAENLRGKGHGIYQASDEVEFQGLFLEAKDAERLIKHTYIGKTKPMENLSGVVRRDN